jgi:hypothetical protein
LEGEFTVKNTYSLDLDFLSPYPLKEGGHPGHAIARIYVKCFGQSEKDGVPIITPDCVNLGEIEQQIERLRVELDRIGETAKGKFLLHDKREKEWITNYRHQSAHGS